jgi:hypothetical protein
VTISSIISQTAVAGPSPHFAEPHFCPAARQSSQTTIDSDIINGLRAPVPIDEREPTETVVVLGACPDDCHNPEGQGSTPLVAKRDPP